MTFAITFIGVRFVTPHPAALPSQSTFQRMRLRLCDAFLGAH